MSLVRRLAMTGLILAALTAFAALALGASSEDTPRLLPPQSAR